MEKLFSLERDRARDIVAVSGLTAGASESAPPGAGPGQGDGASLQFIPVLRFGW